MSNMRTVLVENMQELCRRCCSEGLRCGIIAHPERDIYWLFRHIRSSSLDIFYLLFQCSSAADNLYFTLTAQSSLESFVIQFCSRLLQFVNEKIF